MVREYEQMSLSELEEEKRRLRAEIEAIRQKRRVIAALLDSKITSANAVAKIAAMSDPEKEALRQVLVPEGIPSEEQVMAGGKK